ncbi:MAG: hypothetical protein CMJ81_21820 [Planctomycetaceae bacterium]|nr:hypothetical protein [Planctomycetaceae bacterium]MBP60874.1 hypothetical protein [Planctomycetaceae bacterium]
MAPSETVFPLPLEAFEQYMLADDKTHQPMVLVRQLFLSGYLQQTAFESAIEKAMERHPLLRALVRNSGRHEPYWVAAGILEPRVDWAEIGRPLQTRMGEYLDLTSEVGLRVWVRQGLRSVIVTLQFHHACIDGTGAIQFITDLLAFYGRLTCRHEDPAPELLQLQQELLRQRGRIPPQLAGESGSRVGWTQKVSKLFRFITRKPSPLGPPHGSTDSTNTCPPFPGIVSHTFSKEETQSLKRVAKQQGASLNDLLLRDLFLVINTWNSEHGREGIGRWLRIMMPVNLRTEEFSRLPAANVLSYGFLTRDCRECDEPVQLLAGISRETREIKFGGSSLMFLKSINMLRKIKGGLKRMSDPQKCYATVVLSNVGDITTRLAVSLPSRNGRLVAGDVVLEAVRGCPPLRQNTRAVFHVMTCCGEMTVAARGWPELFGVEETGDLLQRFIHQLHHSFRSVPDAVDWKTDCESVEQPSWEERIEAPDRPGSETEDWFRQPVSGERGR